MQWVNTVVTIVIILVVARISIRLLKRVLENRIQPLESLPDSDPKKQRAKTLLPLLENIVAYVVYGLAIVMAIQELGVNVAAIIAGAGVAGLAIGFGAQSLVKDLISGFFLLFDGLIAVGDLITIDTHTGWVEKIGIRNTQLRKFNGELRTIPNGDLQNFGNMSRGFVRAIVPVGVAYEANIEDAMAVLRKIAVDYAETHQEIVLEEPQVQGIQNFNSSDVEVRVVVKIVPGNQWNVERDIRRAIKAYFDDRNVEIPFPRHVVYVRDEPDWNNTIDTSDTPEEKIPDIEDLAGKGDLSRDEETLGLVQNEVRRLQRRIEWLSGKFKSGGSSSERGEKG